jgi:hypothetical protein
MTTTTPDEDEIEASRAPLIDHLIELRSRLIRALIAFVAMFFGCFFLAIPIYNILVWPYVRPSATRPRRSSSTPTRWSSSSSRSRSPPSVPASSPSR